MVRNLRVLKCADAQLCLTRGMGDIFNAYHDHDVISVAASSPSTRFPKGIAVSSIRRGRPDRPHQIGRLKLMVPAIFTSAEKIIRHDKQNKKSGFPLEKSRKRL
jgi:hypothetical protein